MAANLKKSPEEKKEKGKAADAERRGGIDLKWIMAGLGLVAITMGSVIIGIQLAPGKVVIKETTKTMLVERIVEPGPVVNVLQSQVLNLNGGRYLRLSVALQFVKNEKLWPDGGGGAGGHGAAKPKDPLENHHAMIKDTILTVVGRHTAAELLTPTGKEKLKDEVKMAINRELGHNVKGYHGGGGGGDEAPAVPEVYKVYFTDFVVN